MTHDGAVVEQVPTQDLMRFFEVLLDAFDDRMPSFRGHHERVARYSAAVAKELGFTTEEVELVRTAGRLHDIGMVSVADAMVKKEGSLDPAERAAVRAHCRTGAQILEPLTQLGPVHRYVLEHHERLNGSGYPDAKAGDEISLGGQIVGLAEVWAALTEERPHREAMSPGTALTTLASSTDVWFSSDLIRALHRVVRAEAAFAGDARAR